MAEKFDKYYTHFSRETSGVRRIGLREINLGILRISLGGGVRLGLGGRSKVAEGATSNVMEGEEVRLINPPSNIKVIKGKYVEVLNGELDSVEGEEVKLTNVDVNRVTGGRITIVNGDVGHVEGEYVELVNTDADEVVATDGSFIRCSIGVLKYRRTYTALDTDIGELRRID